MSRKKKIKWNWELCVFSSFNAFRNNSTIKLALISSPHCFPHHFYFSLASPRIFHALFLVHHSFSAVDSVHSFRFRCRQSAVDLFELFHWWNLNIGLVAVRQSAMLRILAHLPSSAILLGVTRYGKHGVQLCWIAGRRFGMCAELDRRRRQLELLRWKRIKQERDG